jgi:hypothetical protein
MITSLHIDWHLPHSVSEKRTTGGGATLARSLQDKAFGGRSTEVVLGGPFAGAARERLQADLKARANPKGAQVNLKTRTYPRVTLPQRRGSGEGRGRGSAQRPRHRGR